MTPFVFDTTLTPGSLSAVIYTPTSGEWLGLIFSSYVTELGAPFRQIVMTDGVTVLRQGAGFQQIPKIIPTFRPPPDPPAPYGAPWNYFRSGAPVVVTIDALSAGGSVHIGAMGTIVPASQIANLRLLNG